MIYFIREKWFYSLLLLKPSTLSFSNILSAGDSVSFMCGTAGVLAMTSKSGIEELKDSLLNELEKL